MMKITFSPQFTSPDLQEKVRNYIQNFGNQGEFLNYGQRNSIKVFDLNGTTINIKSFKKPNAINKVVYRFFRKSKAERSFNYALYLLSKNIGTPEPIAFAEEKSGFIFKSSFYVSMHLEYDLSYRELVTNPDYHNHEEILIAFTRFTHKLHENNIEFLDHSPGNTLIKVDNLVYKFFLVDLNRMNFKNLDLNDRLKNFSHLTPKKEMVEVMASEYSRLINRPFEEIFEKMWYFTEEFQRKFRRKQAFKKKISFLKR